MEILKSVGATTCSPWHAPFYTVAIYFTCNLVLIVLAAMLFGIIVLSFITAVVIVITTTSTITVTITIAITIIPLHC